MAFKHFIRELLGLTIVVSVVFGVLGVMLELFALTALWEHQESIADIFFNESFYLIVFFIPAYCLWKLINHPTLVLADQAYVAMKLESERR
ncbi:hypothetical protein ATG66_3594 [Vibrio sp. ES.051]|uniref:D-fructose-6-phosphate amidotransferase n=1 Tax=Vibrio sp. ES.051 TaxID=1761909 RepID=UPI000BF5F290|nr:D-fructose-6-phosphate amidotransferase [Vibrio sp. ES.051]PFG45313.1 hypothetical protein ATG66_3594 [Vibrio sp. ES.051]